MKKRFAILLVLLLTVTLLTACGSSDIDREALSLANGEYQAVEVDDPDDYIGSWWHLSILEDDHDYGDYLTIYDNEAGNPGVEGKIVLIDDKNIKVKIDPDYYDQLPSGQWKDSGEYLELTYERTQDGIILTNNGKSIVFNWDMSEDAETEYDE